MDMLITVLLALVCLVAISLQRTYAHVPVKELRRRARGGDNLAEALYKASTFGYSLRFLLWIIVGLSAASFFVFTAQHVPGWIAVILSVALVWVAFIWVPAAQASALSEAVAAKLAPAFAWLLNYLHGPISRLVEFIHRFRPIHLHTGLYEKADLLDLLDKQSMQADNRINQDVIEIARNSIMFDDRLVRDVMTPRRKVKMVSVKDDIGPVFLTELHKTGHSSFPVYDGKKDNIVGMLLLRNLVNSRAAGKVKNKMNAHVFYLNEDHSLRDALQAIIKTQNHLFIVLNSLEEYVGILTTHDVLSKIVGEQTLDDFDAYEDRRAVASFNPQVSDEPTEEKAESKPKAKSSPEPDEVIEL